MFQMREHMKALSTNAYLLLLASKFSINITIVVQTFLSQKVYWNILSLNAYDFIVPKLCGLQIFVFHSTVNRMVSS
jgi:hypothetical protein